MWPETQADPNFRRDTGVPGVRSLGVVCWSEIFQSFFFQKRNTTREIGFQQCFWLSGKFSLILKGFAWIFIKRGLVIAAACSHKNVRFSNPGGFIKGYWTKPCRLYDVGYFPRARLRVGIWMLHRFTHRDMIYLWKVMLNLHGLAKKARCFLAQVFVSKPPTAPLGPLSQWCVPTEVLHDPYRCHSLELWRWGPGVCTKFPRGILEVWPKCHV